MKNIVFLASDLNSEYCLTILQGIYKFFIDKKDIHLIITQVKSKDDITGTFTYQFSTGLKMITAKDIDGYIVLPATFGSFFDELIPFIRENSKAPILSIGVELSYENCYSIGCNTKDIYKSLVQHLVEAHNCKKIGFFSGNETKSKEAYERFESFKEALKFHNLEYNEDYVFHGNFTKYFTKNVISQKFHSKSDVLFDAIICANDATAVGCVEGFSALGLSIPNDLKILGFDDSSQASLSFPSISTVSQQITEQGTLASQLIYDKLNGKEIEKNTKIPLAPVYRQSCGCIHIKNNEYIYKNQDGQIITKNTDYRSYIRDYYDRIADSRNIYVIFDFIHSNDTLEHFTQGIDSLLTYTKFQGISFSLYKNSIEVQPGSDFTLPETVKLNTLIDKSSNIKIINEDLTYNPHETIFPKEWDNTPGLFFFQPIFNCTNTYGYFFSRFTESKLEIFNIYMKIINQALAQAIEFSKSNERTHRLQLEKEDLQKTNSNLSKQSRTDELTKILNRRGFMEYGQQLINLSISMDTYGAVFFADLDGLKKINDTHGHKMGDLAIQLASQAIKNTFRKNDIIGRLSGDEFAVITSEMSISWLEKTREKLDEQCTKLQEENNLPFTLSASLGAVEYNKDDYYLKELLTKADENLYEEKKRHHELLNNK